MMHCPNRSQVVTLGVVVTVVASLGIVGLTGTAAAAGSTDVAISPSTQTIDAGTTTTVNITVTNADGGVGAYEFALSTDGMGTASIVDVELYGNPATSTTNISDDGSHLSANAALADTADTGEVTIATVTISGDAAGESALTLSELSIGDEAGNSYSINSVTNGELSVLESTAIQNTELTPSDVDEGQTVATTFDFDVADVSNDGNTDNITLTAPSDVSFASPTATIVGGNGTTIQLESEPSLKDVNGGTDNQILLSIAPDNSIDTSQIDVRVESDAAFPSVSSNQSRSFELDVVDSSGETATDTASLTVVNTDSGDDTDSKQDVAITPATQKVSVSETTTYDVVVRNVTNGVGAYELTLATGSAEIATITEVELGGDPADSTTSVSYSDDNSSVAVEAALADTADTGDVSILTISVRGETSGNTTISPSISTLGDEKGTAIEVASVAGGSLQVKAGPGDVTGNGNAATDPDGDGVYEDINGDGSANVLDVQSLFGNLDSDGVSGNTAFDMNGDGSVDILDVQALFAQI